MEQTTNETPVLLDGIKVLDFTHALAGPTCTRILSDLGAEVIKLEPTPGGEFGRSLFPVQSGEGSMFLYTCAGKQSLCVDLKTSAGMKIAKGLVEKVDVVVENFAPGVMTRLGLDYDSLQTLNPKIIMASCSGFGQTGPLSKNTSYDIIGQAMSSVMHMTGEATGPPQYVGNYIGDTNTGVHAALAVCAALFYRDRSGKGQLIDIAQVDSLFWLDMINIPLYSLSKGEQDPKRFGAHHFAVAPLGVFQGNDGYIVLQAVDHQFPQLARAMGRDDLCSDAKFSTNDSRLENRDELVSLIEEWLQSFENDEAALDALAEVRIPCAPVLDVGEAFNHPHIRARGMISEVDHPLLGRMQITNTPFVFSETPRAIQGPAPLIGQHNRTILTRHLGYSESEIQDLTSKNVLVEESAVKTLKG